MTETASKNKRRAQFWKGLDSMKPKTAAFPWGLLCPSTPCCWATSGEEQTDLTMGRKFRDREVGRGDVFATTGDVCATTAFVNTRSMDPEGQGSQKSHCGDLFQIDLVSLPKKKHNSLSHKLGPNSLYKTPFYSHHHQTHDLYRYRYKVLNRHMFWVSNPLWT